LEREFHRKARDMPFRHILAAVLVFVGHFTMAYGTVSGGAPIVSLGALLISVAKILE
jgi:hypothetical protein